MSDPPRFTVTVMYAGREQIYRAEVVVSAGATVADAIACSEIREQSPQVEIHEDRLGIFSRKATLATLLRAGDRVEIYRPLKVDPKEARRRRARNSAKS